MPGFDVLDPALNLKKNYFLEASAGTGKTFAIENIVVRLVEEGIPFKNILVVTFTRAATFELKSRIYKLLERKKLRSALQVFEDAQIFTIHGFCFHALKENALETCFPIVQKENCASPEIRKRIYKDFLRIGLTSDEIHARQLEKVLSLYQQQPEKLFDALSQNLTGNGRSFRDVFDDILQEIEKLRLNQEDVFIQFLNYTSLFSGMYDRKKNIKREVEIGLGRFINCAQKKETDVVDVPLAKMVPENLLKGKVYPDLLKRCNERLIPLLQEISNAENILSRLKEKAEIFRKNVCTSENLFFYEDLLTEMHKQMGNNLFLKKVRGEYQAVLMDEFQDTDKLQWEIFSKLFFGTHPMYLVGDPKQSIYRFRGADLYTYLDAKNIFGKESYATLTKNFRSDGTLVKALNILFSRTPNLITLPRTGDVLSIEPIEPALDATANAGITFCRCETEEKMFSYCEREIEKIHIEEHVPYNNFAVLVKDRYQAKRFLKFCQLPCALKKMKVYWNLMR
jgi:exodeoxyribonuclease V beta subunit